MWRKLSITFMMLTLLLLTVSTAMAQEKSYSADRFDVDVVVQGDGSLLVTETVIFTFVGEPFTFVFREIPTGLTDGITILSASVDGRSYPAGTNAGQVEIEDGRDIRVTWYFEPSVNVTRTFVLQYQMLGVVRQETSADLLRYQPLPDEYEYSIASSTVTFTYPRTAVLQADPRITTGSGRLSKGSGVVVLENQNIGPNETVIVELPFAPGSLINEPPIWQARRAEQNALGPIWLGVGVFILAGGAVAAVWLWRSHQPRFKPGSTRLYEPPGELPPAIAGLLNGTGAKPSWSNALATLFDLADRGILRIEEAREKKWYRGHDFEIVLVKEPSDLRPHEQGLLDLIFETKKGPQTAVQMSKLSSHISGKQWKKFSEPLEAEVKAAGYIDADRKARRQRLMIFSLVILGLSFIMFVFMPLILFDQFGAWPVAIAISLLLLFVIMISAASAMTVLTDEAKLMANEWESFNKYLKDVVRKKAAVGGTEMFTRFLPYAASYGLLHQWARFFQKEGWTELPPYFHTLAKSGDDGMAAFVAMTATTASSGGSAAGAGGAGGAAGGGASGAG